ncbi:MAG: hypothetical protein U1F34_01220 [Gammaproteobacteria bacterium]
MSSINEMNHQIATAAEEQSSVVESLNRNVAFPPADLSVNTAERQVSGRRRPVGHDGRDVDGHHHQVQDWLMERRIEVAAISTGNTSNPSPRRERVIDVNKQGKESVAGNFNNLSL